MRRGQAGGHGLAGRHGLLPLPLVPFVVGRTRQRLQPLEAGGRADHLRRRNVATFEKTQLSQRQYCTKCGGHLMTNHPPLGLVDVFAATIPTLNFTPGVHVNYAETVLPDAGRPAEAEGLPGRVWRLRRGNPGITDHARTRSARYASIGLGRPRRARHHGACFRAPTKWSQESHKTAQIRLGTLNPGACIVIRASRVGDGGSG